MIRKYKLDERVVPKINIEIRITIKLNPVLM